MEVEKIESSKRSNGSCWGWGWDFVNFVARRYSNQNETGVTSSKNDGFSLSTGDFSSLGSEKDNSDHGCHGRLGSSSSGVASLKEHTADSTGSWRKESSMCGEDEISGLHSQVRLAVRSFTFAPLELSVLAANDQLIITVSPY
ncbi:uncharacterized protein [Euphorbia lathyris]|uniref:uncharacterized protein isoform X2 n=1 Tax=Euphorbia lathyris TaxID=212925 RepID=UPI00331407BC